MSQGGASRTCGDLGIPATGEGMAEPLPTWVPEDVHAYLAHTFDGRSIRAVARECGCPPSTISRRVRRIESRRDDLLVDLALNRLCASAYRRHAPRQHRRCDADVPARTVFCPRRADDRTGGRPRVAAAERAGSLHGPGAGNGERRRRARQRRWRTRGADRGGRAHRGRGDGAERLDRDDRKRADPALPDHRCGPGGAEAHRGAGREPPGDRRRHRAR